MKVSHHRGKIIDNNVIGRDNDLVWDLPADQRFLDEQIKVGLLADREKVF
jgi:hypothetical protein